MAEIIAVREEDVWFGVDIDTEVTIESATGDSGVEGKLAVSKTCDVRPLVRGNEIVLVDINTDIDVVTISDGETFMHRVMALFGIDLETMTNRSAAYDRIIRDLVKNYEELEK